MQNKGVKSVFKRGNLTCNMYGVRPLIPDTYFFDMFCNMFSASDMKSVRVVVDNKVFEMHTDKHNNIIYREYEKKK